MNVPAAAALIAWAWAQAAVQITRLSLAHRRAVRAAQAKREAAGRTTP